MDFYEKVALVCRRIPKGRVASYGQIARLCGKLYGARQVGFALANRLEDVPAHRVVNSQGYLSGAHAFLGPDMQRKMLEAEGVLVSPNGRVDMKFYAWSLGAEKEELLSALFEENT